MGGYCYCYSSAWGTSGQRSTGECPQLSVWTPAVVATPLPSSYPGCGSCQAWAGPTLQWASKAGYMRRSWAPGSPAHRAAAAALSSVLPRK